MLMQLKTVFLGNTIIFMLFVGMAHATEHISNPLAPALGPYPIDLRARVCVDERL